MSNLYSNFVGRSVLPIFFFLWFALFVAGVGLGVSPGAFLAATFSFDIIGIPFLILLPAWYFGGLPAYSLANYYLALSPSPKDAIATVMRRMTIVYVVSSTASLLFVLLRPESWPRPMMIVVFIVVLCLTDQIVRYWGGHSGDGVAPSPRVR